MKRMRYVVPALAGSVLIACLVLTIVAVGAGDGADRSNLTLGVAWSSLAIATMKIIVDLFVAPGDQLRLKRRERRETRTEDAASEIRALLGLGGTVLIGRVEEAWASGDTARLEHHARLLGDAAAAAYRIAERASDTLEILVGFSWSRPGT